MTTSVRCRFIVSALSCAMLSCALAGCGDGELGYEEGEELSGGDTTVFEAGRDAFSLVARNITRDRKQEFFVGNALFNRNWVTAPSSTSEMDGIGPTYNASSCSACHFKDGRGAPPDGDGDFVGLLVRLSVPGQDAHGGPLGDPSYGTQLNHRSILGVPAEGTPRVEYEEVPGTFADGTPYSLRKPTYSFDDLAFGPMDPDVMVSPRTAPFMIGLGLLETVDESTILARADEGDADDDGISGRPNWVWDPLSQSVQLGRFGWKANVAGLEQQTAGALLGDMGISTPLHPDQNCPLPQTDCDQAIDGGSPEIDQDKIDTMTYYANLLAVPARRDYLDREVLRGKMLFTDLGCAGCHTPELETGERADFPELEHQRIRPYSDLLLHDMGPDLADGRPDYGASGNEWRTPPLWGIGLVEVVNGHSDFLHDGRARSLSEAILWHGGEAAPSRDAFRSLPAAERDALVRFLESL